MTAVLILLTALAVVSVAGLVVVLLGDERLQPIPARTPRELRTHGESWRLADARRRQQIGVGAESVDRKATGALPASEAPLPAVHASPRMPLGWLPNERPAQARQVDVLAIPLAPIGAFADPPAVYDLFQRIQPSGGRGVKRCSSCYQDKPATEFFRCEAAADGLQAWCKRCMAHYQATYRRTYTPPRPAATRKRRRGLTVCVCDVAQLGGPFRSCLSCGLPIVSLMSPRLQAAMAVKYPPIVDQQVVDPDRELMSA